MWNYLKKISFSLICIITAVLLIGAAYQFISAKLDEQIYPPPGKLVDVGGYRLHINCAGEDGPTVVFDAGMGGNSLSWSLVQPAVSKFAKTCSYDRAGNGWSDESPLERSSQNIVDELHMLLKNANVPGPYILVGHSFGGANMLLYANRYPDDVAGIILVDSCHEDYLEKMMPMPNVNENMIMFMTYFGGVRLIYPNLSTYKRQLEKFPDHIKYICLSRSTTNQFIRTVFQELALLDKSFKQLKATGSNLGNKPLIVITAGIEITGEEFNLSEEELNRVRNEWKALQANLAKKSTNGKQIIAENSGHMIPLEQPEIVIESIREMTSRSKPTS